jgi:hypothetical protein
MHKIDSDGATIDNKFTEGNPTLSIPATVVSAAIANAWQEELVNVIEGVGITLLTSGTDTFDQLDAAIKELFKRGGRAAPVSQAIANNQASAADVTNFPTFDRTVVAAVEFLYSVFRRTDSSNKKETGRGFITWNSETSAWEVSIISVHEGADVEFAIALVSGNIYKLRYTSDNMAGASYAGTLRISDIKTILV